MEKEKTCGFPPVVGNQPAILILGTMPGKKSLSLGQYYANPRNQIWSILSHLLNECFPMDYSGKIEVLKRNGIALWDVLQAADREGSLDANIRNETPNDLPKFIAEHPTIRVIGLNGKKAAEYFYSYVNSESLPKSIKVIVLKSSSSMNSRDSLRDKEENWQQLFK